MINSYKRDGYFTFLGVFFIPNLLLDKVSGHLLFQADSPHLYYSNLREKSTIAREFP